MKHTSRGLLVAFCILLSAACNNDSTTSANGNGSDSTVAGADAGKSAVQFEAGGLKITSLEGSTAYPDAKLGLVNPPAGADLAAGTNRFEFSVTAFQLGTPTSDQGSQDVANDEKGQYAALVLNNGPVIPMYAPTSDQTLADGHYVMLAFPSRSYHESVKNPGGHILRQFNVGQPENYKELDTKAPHIFYHWPTGTLAGGGKVLLDFFLVNCTLGPADFKVKATLNGTEFTLTKWAAYSIEGLPMGENRIKLELIDATGKTVESPYNPVERTFTVQTGA